MDVKEHPSYKYVCKVIKGEVKAPRYVILQCAEFKNIADGFDAKYCINKKKLVKCDKLLKCMVMPKGIKARHSIYSALIGYQWLFIVATLCVAYRDEPQKRRYEISILEICRKNFKTYTIGILFLLLMMTEPPFSKLYSVAPDGALSREVRNAIAEIIASSPALLEKNRFKVRRDDILFLLNRNDYIPLSYSNSRLDGRLPSAFLVDEAGALPNSYAIEAMQSGQVSIFNKLGCIISTKYPKFDNPFEKEVGYAKKVLDGLVEDEHLFALLYEPDDTVNWATNDEILLQANPASQEVGGIWDDLMKKRSRAIEMESARENFITKHCNILYQGVETESFVPVSELQKCKVEKIDWAGREVYLGVDLSMSNDNCSVAMAAEDDGKILGEAIAFIPEDRIEEKNRVEGIDYYAFIRQKKCIACGDSVIDYAVIENFVFEIEGKYGVKVMGIGYDRYNAMSSAQKWERGRSEDDDGYNTVIVRQHSDTLHPPTKLLYEKILSGQFAYEKNELLEINFQNARCTFDTNMNRYVNKKRSAGKIDMVAALINAVYLLQQNVYFSEQPDFVFQA